VLKAKNLQIQALTNVLNDNDSEVDSEVEFDVEESKIESVVSEESEAPEEMPIHALKDQITTAYFNDE